MLFPVLDYFGRTFGPNEFGSAVRSVSNNSCCFFCIPTHVMTGFTLNPVALFLKVWGHFLIFFYCVTVSSSECMYIHFPCMLIGQESWKKPGALWPFRQYDQHMTSEQRRHCASVKGSKDKLTSGSNASPMLNSFFTFWGTFLLWILAMWCIGYGHGEEYLL